MENALVQTEPLACSRVDLERYLSTPGKQFASAKTASITMNNLIREIMLNQLKDE